MDILVNNAGAIRPGSLLTKPDADWQVDWSLKVFGYVRLAREVFPVMQSQGGGRIIDVIGSAGRQPNTAYLAGGGANAAIMNMTKALADEGAPHRILVNGINPGPIRTERWDMLMTRIAAERGQTPPRSRPSGCATILCSVLASPRKWRLSRCFWLLHAPRISPGP